MWRRLNREDFSGANPLVEEGRSRTFEFTWAVYHKYEVELETWHNAYYVATEGLDDEYFYDPLLDTPYLFLEFARLAEHRNRDEAVWAWISRHGLLGLHRDERYPRRHEHVPSLPPSDYRSEGGPGERLDFFDEEVDRANRVLTLYEEALSRDEEKLEQSWAILSPKYYAFDPRDSIRISANDMKCSYLDALVHEVTREVLKEAGEVISEYCYPYLTPRSPSGGKSIQEKLTPEHLMPTIRPRNLLGAMYAQFYWLLASGGDLSRCKHCGRIISHASPTLGEGGRRGRKPRKDKEFCDSRCRQNYHYHHRIKGSS